MEFLKIQNLKSIINLPTLQLKKKTNLICYFTSTDIYWVPTYCQTLCQAGKI